MGWNGGALRGALALISLGVLGCNPPPATTSVDSGPRVDMGPQPQPVVATTPPATVDLSCLGSATVPTPGASTTGTLHIFEFLSMGAITGNHVDVFSDNVITDTCDAPGCTTYSTDSSGNISLTLGAGQWFGYRLQESGQTANVLSYNQPWMTAPGELDVPGFAPSTITAVGMLIMRTFQADRFGSMSGRVADCQGHPLANVQPRVFVGDTELLTGAIADPMSSRVTGLEGTAPTRNGLTGQSGNFVGANVPPTEDCHVEAWATLHDGELPQLIGCMQGRVVVGGITISIVGPLRSDYAPGSRCALAAAAAGH